MSIKKKILLTIAFVVATLIVPAVLLLLFVDALTSFAAYVVTFGIILFAILGFIVISLVDIQSTLKSTVEELKMQNAAIAYKLTSSVDASSISDDAASENADGSQQTTDTTKVNLNPADPLVMPVVKKKEPVVEKKEPVVEKKTDDGFDDFQ